MSELAHGGRISAAVARYGGNVEDWLDLSTGINPNGYPVPNLAASVWSRLPDEDGEVRVIAAARQAYAVRDNLHLVAANGTQAIIERLPDVFTGSDVRILTPTYGEHAFSWEKAGRDVSLAKTVEALMGADIAVVTNPNNPDGRILPVSTLHEIADGTGTLIIDEAFCDAYPDSSIIPTMPANVIVLRSFGKFYGLAGLRLGFAIGSAQICALLNQLFGPWAVSGPALAIGAAALQDEAWKQETITHITKQSEALVSLLKEFGFEIAGENALFVYLRDKRAVKLQEHLSQSKILVRGFSERSEYLRFGLCRDDQEISRLRASLESFDNG